MIFKQTILIFLLMHSNNLFAQDTLQFEPVALSRLVIFENSLHSELKGLQYFNPYYDEDFEDLTDEHPNVQKKVMIFKRNYDAFSPTLHSWYFFDKDSVVRLIYYNWGLANTSLEASDDELRWQQYRKGDFAKKYENEKAILIKKLGKPDKEDEKESNSAILNVTTIWDMPDKRVVLEMTGDRKIAEHNMTGTKKTVISPHSSVVIKVMLKN